MAEQRRRGRASLLDRYGGQLGLLVERRHAEAALMASKQKAERHAALAESANEQLRQEMEQRLRALADLEYLASHDPLTGLPNRAVFARRLTEAMRDAERRDEVLALMFLDLDHFKDVNDTLGHAAGDQLLVEVARRLRACVRSQDTVARLGGDEFAIIQVDLNFPDDAKAVAGRIIERLVEPFALNGQKIFSGGSIGITVYPRDSQCPDQLQKNADLAMYRAKQERRNGFQFFDTDLDERVHRRAFIEQELRQALPKGQLDVFFQPKIAIRSGAVAGAEALVRWRHPDDGMVRPDEFIPVAERIGLIGEIGEFVLHESCRRFREWNAGLGVPVKVAVNVSAAQFKHRDMPAVVRGILADTGYPAELLELEITETAVMGDMRNAAEVLHDLHALGVSISIDDFGTGYSSLNYLRQLPVDRMKIDRSFVADIESGGDAAAIARAIVALGRSLNLEIVAEGVENAAQLEYLRRIGCDEAQGYYFSKPLPAAEFERYLARSGGLGVAV